MNARQTESTFSLDAAAPVPVRRRWTRVLPAPVRSFGRPLLHAWQYLYDTSRGKWRIYRERRASERADRQDRRKLLEDSTPILRDVHGFRFVLYPHDRPNMLTLARHAHDVGEFEAIPRLVGPGDVALDVGAHLGFYSVLLSRVSGPSGRVWAFEPVPETYWRLRETLALNRCDNVVPVQAAICEKDGTATMHLFEPQYSEWNTLGVPSMLKANGDEVRPSGSIEVPSRTLDSVCEMEGIKRVRFLKVDVEGFELCVFYGARRLLEERRVDYICFEISKDPLRGAGLRSRQVFEALEKFGYSSYQFDRSVGRFRGPIRDTSEHWSNFYASWRTLEGL